MFIRLTETNGNKIYLNILQINKIISKDSGSILFGTLGPVTVKESPQEIMQIIQILITDTVVNILSMWRQTNG